MTKKKQNERSRWNKKITPVFGVASSEEVLFQVSTGMVPCLYTPGHAVVDADLKNDSLFHFQNGQIAEYRAKKFKNILFFFLSTKTLT